MFDRTFRNIADVVRGHAAARPQQPALVQGERQLTFAELDAMMDRVAVALQRDGVCAGDVIALCGSATPHQAALFLGGLRAGAVVAPLASSVTPVIFASLLRDAGARLLFVDAAAAALVPADMKLRCIALDADAPGRPLDDWLAAPGAGPLPVIVEPESPFVVRRAGEDISAADLREWMNARGSKTQRLADLICVDELPRNALGKILKRELRERYLIEHSRAFQEET